MSYEKNPGFYSEWTVEASNLYIAMDEEFQCLLEKLGVRKGCIPSVLEYYESHDAESLTKKISSIPAFQGISSPMKLNKFGNYEPDFTSRYFTEDFPFGLKFIHTFCLENDIPCPNISMVLKWGLANTGFSFMQPM